MEGNLGRDAKARGRRAAEGKEGVELSNHKESMLS